MKGRSIGAILIIFGLCVMMSARSESADDTPASALNALLAEVRQLRLAIERQSALAGRAQLLVGRLALQDQRVARWHTEVQRLDAETSSSTLNLTRTQALLAERRTAIARAKDAEEAAGIEAHIRMMEAQLKQESANLATIETRRAEASQALEAERARYEELSARVEQLERDLASSQR